MRSILVGASVMLWSTFASAQQSDSTAKDSAPSLTPSSTDTPNTAQTTTPQATPSTSNNETQTTEQRTIQAQTAETARVYTAPAYASPEVAIDRDLDRSEERDGVRGVTVMAGGGIEGYTGSLAHQIDPGLAWGVTAAIKPTRVLGLELGYSGAANNISSQKTGISGPDIVRNGGTAIATVGIATAHVQPYLLGGVGVNYYSVRAPQHTAGFKNDTNGIIPLGGGIRGYFGHFTADARFDYGVPFSQHFASDVGSQNVLGLKSIDAGRYQGMLQLGSSF